MTSRAAQRRGLRRATLFMASFALAFLALELSARGAMHLRGKPWAPEHVGRQLEAMRQELHKVDWRPQEQQVARGEDPSRIILHPYLGFDTLAAQAMYARVAHQMQAAPDDPVAHVVVIGGSVSCLLVGHAQRRIVEGLKKDPRWRDRPIMVHVLGQGGMKQPQQAMSLGYAFAMGWRPALVINVDGFNEVSVAYQNTSHGAHPLHPSVTHWGDLLKARRGSLELNRARQRILETRDRATRRATLTLESGALNSAMLGYLGWRSSMDLAGRFRALQREYVALLTEVRDPSMHGPPVPPDQMSILREAVIGWAESSVSIAAMCAVRGVPYLHVLQPTLHDEGSKPLTEAEVASGWTGSYWKQGSLLGYPLLRAAGKSLARRGVHFLDASMIFADVEETLYYDACHFNARGSEMLADAITSELLLGHVYGDPSAIGAR